MNRDDRHADVPQELEYLVDSSVLSPQQLSRILSQLPQQTQLHAPLITPATTPQPSVDIPPSINSNEKQEGYYARPPGPPPPPVYVPHPTLAWASALYAYNPTDAGDVALLPSDRIAVLEYMNAEWWKGRNERTGQEGIFPRNYVKVIDEKNGPMPAVVPAPATTGYGNLPLEVSQGGSNPADPAKPSKLEEQGKKFGKKLGNATIFGAVGNHRSTTFPFMLISDSCHSM